jgi:arylsulfatase A-like enzyme
MLDNLDENVGRLLDKLDELKLSERTLVIFVSDNGGLDESTSNLPLRDEKASLYEGGIRVPMIVRWPGVVVPGSTSHEPVISEDFWPTLREVARLGGKPKQALDGVSLLPILQGKSLQRDTLCWHFPHYTGGTKPCSAIRRGDYKLIQFYEDGHVELYDLKKDLGEKTNLATGMPDKAKELQARLTAWLKSTNAEMPAPNPGKERN